MKLVVAKHNIENWVPATAFNSLHVQKKRYKDRNSSKTSPQTQAGQRRLVSIYPKLFTEQDTNIDEYFQSIVDSGTMISGFTPTMDSSGMWDSTCSGWHSRCSGRASHPMRVKSDYSAGKRVNIVGLDVTTCKHM